LFYSEDDILRKIIFHYHFFKNAGTSVDVLLKRSFPGQWVAREFDSNQFDVNLDQVKNWLDHEQSALVFSSHTAMLPPPELDDIEIFPIVFIRHPIDRIASAYAFERIQDANTAGTLLARQTTFAGYIETQLAHGRFSQCRNFHIYKLMHMFKGKTGDQASLAIAALDSLPFVGLVEDYQQSIDRLVNWLSPHFPNIKPIAVTKNVTRDNTLSLEQKLEQIRHEIGSECYEKLIAANAEDIAVFNAVQKKYAKM